jgi:hypothetical protein
MEINTHETNMPARKRTNADRQIPCACHQGEYFTKIEKLERRNNE